ncbi:MAG: hypothetical protein ABUT20_05480 [Bacteroidota bacterium]
MEQPTPPGIAQKVKRRLEDPFKTFKAYERIIAAVCISIPLILRIYDKDIFYPVKVKLVASDNLTDAVPKIEKDWLGFRLSISDYAYSLNSYLFGMLLCIAAMLFIFNGAVYFKSQRSLSLNSKGKWYNVILGISLLGVICCPHRDWQILHYIFAAIFFFGNAIVTIVFHNKDDKKKSITMGILTVIFLLLAFLDDHFKLIGGHFTIFWGEWFSLTVIGIHLILESRLVNYYRFKKND